MPTDTHCEEQLAATAEAMGTLSDPTRLKILLLLTEGERGVTELYTRIGCPQATASHHLAVLRAAGIVRRRRDGRRILYRLTDPQPARGVVRVPAGDGSILVQS